MDDRLKVLMLHRQQSAVGYYRTWVPARWIAKNVEHIQPMWWEEGTYTRTMKPTPYEWLGERIGEFDVLYVDRALDRGMILGQEKNPQGLALFVTYRHHSEKTRMIMDFDDDFCDLPWWNPMYSFYQPGQEAHEVGLWHLKWSELCSVSTDVLAERFRDKTHNILAIPNSIDPIDWVGLPVNPDRQSDPCLRVLYGGANGHFGDLDEVKEGIRAMIEKPPVPWRLVCFGAIPAWLHELRHKYPERVQSLPWVPFTDYPAAIAWGGFDLAIAPLAAHPFNAAKSDIKWLEAGIQKIPLLCSDFGPYADIPDGHAIKVPHSHVRWAEALRETLLDSSLRKSISERTFEKVMDERTIDRVGPLWQAAIERAATLPRIVSQEAARLPSEAISSPVEGSKR